MNDAQKNAARPAAIRVQSLSKSFGNVRPALDAVDIEIAEGEMVALIGASGSGKSTLIRHIAALAKGDRGRIAVLGSPVQADGRIDRNVRRVRRRVGVVFQQFNLVSRMTLLGNVLIGLLGQVPAWRGYLGRFTPDEKRRAMAALDFVGLADRAGQRASTLSGGQQQRGAIARTLLQEAEIVLADEPIASLDPQAARRVMEVLARINRDQGVTILVSLHQVAYAMAYCPRTIALRDGKVVYDGASDVLTPEFLATLYGSESESLFLPDTATIAKDRGRASSQPDAPDPASLAGVAFATA